MNGLARVTRASSATWREVDGQVAIISIDVNRIRLLNRVGGFLWKLCDGRTVDAMEAELAGRYRLDPAAATHDVRTFLEDLVTRGLVTIVEEGS